MANIPPTKPGSIVDVPKQETPRWVTTEQAKQFTKYVGKAFVPKDNEKFSKSFFYRVVSIMPYVPASLEGGVGQTLYKFLVQKYHRNKTQSVSVSDGKGGRETITDNSPVEGHRLNDDGFWECIDDTASMTVDVNDFKAKYESDKIGDED